MRISRNGNRHNRGGKSIVPFRSDGAVTMSPDEYSFRATEQRRREQEQRSRMDRFALDARARQYAGELAAKKPVSEMTVGEAREALTAQWA